MTVRHARAIRRDCASLHSLTAAALLFTLCSAAAAGAQISIEVPTTVVGTPVYSPDGTQFPGVAASPDGTVVFIYAEFFTPLLAVTHAYTQTGVELGPPAVVSQGGKVYFTNIASDLRGGFIAAWDWNENHDNDSIMARRLDGQGHGTAAQITVNSDRPTMSAYLSHVAGLPNGSVFMWEQDNTLWIRLYDRNGVSRGPSTKVAPVAITLNVTSDVVALSNGGFVVSWADLYVGRSWARLYDGNGQPNGPVFSVSDDFDMQRLAAFPGGWAAIGTSANREWRSPEPDVYTPNRVVVSRFDNQGTPLGAEITVHDAGFREYISTDLTIDTRGYLYAAWIQMNWDSDRLTPPYARAFDANGDPLGAFSVLSDRGGWDVQVAPLPNGGIVTMWEGQGNYPLENDMLATWVRVCPGDEACVAPPTATPSLTPTVTSTPTPTPGCGDGRLDSNEECDDGNQASSDGCDAHCRAEECGDARLEGDEQCDPPTADGRCKADCTIAPAHDSVMIPENPIDVVIPASQVSFTKIVPVQVRNADIEPWPERPGHVIRVVASDGTCPAGTIQGAADFERGIDGDQDSTLVAGGTRQTAHVTVFVSRDSFANLDLKIPQRCTLQITAATLVDGNVDPTPENNTISVELNVRAAGNDKNLGKLGSAASEPGFFVRSAKPLKLTIAAGQATAQKSVAFRISNGLPAGSADRQVQLAVDDGGCAPGTVSINALAGSTGDARSVVLRPGTSRSGKLSITVRREAANCANRQSPARCTATLWMTDASGLPARPNQRTTITVETTDFNDFRN